MALPAQLDPIKFYAGDDLVIEFFFSGMDLSGKTFVSYIKASAEDTTHIAFDVNCYYDIPTTTTWLILSLDGDSALNTSDGDTRDIPLSAVFDVQVFQGATQEPTMFRGTLEGQMDVTR